jgi:hypothetical protein
MRTSIALVALALALALVAVPGAWAERSYADPAGDAGVAPDITAVAVSHDAAGIVTLSVTTNQPVLAPDAWVWGYLDRDHDSTTGMPIHGLGADEVFLADVDGGIMAHINGSSLSFDFDGSFSASYANGTLTARFPRDDIGSTDRFAFVIEAEQDDANGNAIAADVAPDAPPSYEYSFLPLQLDVGPVTASPRQPVSGKRLVVSAAVTRSDAQAFTAGSVTCRARAGTAVLRPAASVVGGSARCAMKIPKGAKGKLVRGSIAVSAEDSSIVTRPFSFRVR